MRRWRSTGQMKDSNPGQQDFKQVAFEALQSQSPKLAALVHKSPVIIDGKDVSIKVNNEFTQKHLLQSKKTIEKVFGKILNQEIELHVEVAEHEKKENDLENTIRVLFDGEEVR